MRVLTASVFGLGFLISPFNVKQSSSCFLFNMVNRKGEGCAVFCQVILLMAYRYNVIVWVVLRFQRPRVCFTVWPLGSQSQASLSHSDSLSVCTATNTFSDSHTQTVNVTVSDSDSQCQCPTATGHGTATGTVTCTAHSPGPMYRYRYSSRELD